MAGPRDPRDPTGPPAPDEEPRGTDPGWVRPSERRRAADRPESTDPPTSDPSEPGPPTRTPSESDRPAASDGGAGEVLPAAAAFDDEPGPAGATVAGFAVPNGDSVSTPRRQNRTRQRHRRRLIAGGVALLAVLALIAGVVLTSGGGSTPTAEKVRLKIPPTTAVKTPGPATIATTKVLALVAYAQPTTTSQVVGTFSPKTSYGLTRTMLVTGVRPGWYQVLVPQRPNDTSGWIQQADVTTSTTTYKLTVQLSSHHLWLTNAGKPVLDTPAVIGTGATPTPTGLFYVTDPVDLRTNPNTAYGVFALGLSGYSNVLTSFEGGPGQIAVHGTNNAAQVGQSISNGCVRIPNPDILQIAAVVPLGTPVQIDA
jgi:lipoprotein-anchoring transpeptidase ErfK/SrfK